jgi:hypothetical protein
MDKINTVSYLNKINSKQKNPFIRLSGKWLQENGFNIGSKYKVKVSNKLLILEIENKYEARNENL